MSINVAIILAGGIGSRVESSSIPKQFIEINGTPIFWHTVEKFLINPKIDYIVIACHDEWISYVKNTIVNYDFQEKILICNGGGSRNESIFHAINFLELKLKDKLDKNSTIITHDAVRMFIDSRIIDENIDMCKKFNVVNTIIPSSDTIAISKDSKTIFDIPERSHYFQGQTPQSANWEIIKNIYKNQKNNDFFDRCDLCKLAILNSESIGIVIGSYSNFKITTDFDLKIAKILVEKNDKLQI